MTAILNHTESTIETMTDMQARDYIVSALVESLAEAGCSMQLRGKPHVEPGYHKLQSTYRFVGGTGQLSTTDAAVVMATLQQRAGSEYVLVVNEPGRTALSGRQVPGERLYIRLDYTTDASAVVAEFQLGCREAALPYCTEARARAIAVAEQF